MVREQPSGCGLVEGWEVEDRPGAATDQAGLHLTQEVARSGRQRDQHPLGDRGPGEVVQQSQRRLVRLVQVVHDEQQPAVAGGQAEQLRRRDEQPLVRGLAAPRRLLPGQRAVELQPEAVVQPVEQRRVLPAEVAERLEDGGVRPGALHQRRRTPGGPPAAPLGQRDGQVEHGGLAHAGRPGQQQGAAAPGVGAVEVAAHACRRRPCARPAVPTAPEERGPPSLSAPRSPRADAVPRHWAPCPARDAATAPSAPAGVRRRVRRRAARAPGPAPRGRPRRSGPRGPAPTTARPAAAGPGAARRRCRASRPPTARRGPRAAAARRTSPARPRPRTVEPAASAFSAHRRNSTASTCTSASGSSSTRSCRRTRIGVPCCVVGLQRPARVVRRLVQPRQRGVRRDGRPQGVDDLLAVQAAALGEGEQLDQRRGAASRPGVGGHRRARDSDREGPEHRDLYVHARASTGDRGLSG